MTTATAHPVLVTGASGYIGRRLCALLCEKGVPLRAVYRRPEPPEELLALASKGVELVRADLETKAGVALAVRGASSVIHVAALARDWGKPGEFQKANVDAVLSLLSEAESAGVEEFIYVGTVAVHGFGHHDGSTEDGPYYPLGHPYPATKLEAEKAVLARNRPGFRTSSLRLGYVYGPGDTTSTYRMFAAASKGRFGYIGPGSKRTSLVYVDEACAALAAGLGNAAIAGEAINLIGDEAVSWRELAAAVYGALGSKARPNRLPLGIARIVSQVLAALYRAAGSQDGPALTPYRIRRASVEYVFSNAKARRLLGFSPSIGYREGFRLAAEAYRREKNS